MRPDGSVFAAVIVLVLAGCGVTGCSDGLPKIKDLNPFAEKQAPLPGRRIPVIQAPDGLPGELADGFKAITLPPARANETWAQPGGEPNNAPGHLALAATVNRAWSADAGEGSSKKGRVTAPPIVYDGRIYTLDSEARVTAFSGSGSQVWRVSLAPESETAGGWLSLGGGGGGGYGGGLAADGGRVVSASGYGVIAALDPATGKKLWEKSLGGPVRAAPTAAGDRVFVLMLDGRFFCLSGADGSELWVARGLPQQASLVQNASPAVEGEIVVVPYPTGDLIALKVSDGTPVWTESVSRARSTSQLGSLSNTARPAIEGGTVYAVGHAGRMIATESKTGERRWSLNLPGTQTPWVVGDSVFVVDTAGQILAVTRDEGKVQWSAKLPGGSWSGPTLAGGMLWLASSQGQLVSVDPMTGSVKTQQDVGSPVYIAPVVAQNRMYILTDDAELLAYN